jgi:hypothetical protein
MNETLETQQLTSSDGTIAHYVNIDGVNKMHNWDGAALIPQGNKRQSEYYLFGIKHTKDQWLEKKKDVNGVPFYKSSLGKASGARM